jgi:hypothetical protein
LRRCDVSTCTNITVSRARKHVCIYTEWPTQRRGLTTPYFLQAHGVCQLTGAPCPAPQPGAVISQGHCSRKPSSPISSPKCRKKDWHGLHLASSFQAGAQLFALFLFAAAGPQHVAFARTQTLAADIHVRHGRFNHPRLLSRRRCAGDTSLCGLHENASCRCASLIEQTLWIGDREC